MKNDERAAAAEWFSRDVVTRSYRLSQALNIPESPTTVTAAQRDWEFLPKGVRFLLILNMRKLLDEQGPINGQCTTDSECDRTPVGAAPDIS